jgi:hypothetical protein
MRIADRIPRSSREGRGRDRDALKMERRLVERHVGSFRAGEGRSMAPERNGC